MWTPLRKLTAIAIGALVLLYGIYKIIATLAVNGWLMPSGTRTRVLEFMGSFSEWHRILLGLIFIGLPVLHVFLWWRSRAADRMIRVGDGVYVQESAISGFLRSGLSKISEIKSISARCKMIRGKGLNINCHIEMESREQFLDAERRLRDAVCKCMAERLAIVPVANVEITIKSLSADEKTAELAAAAHRAPDADAPKPKPAPAPGPEPRRATIDFSPAGEEEDEKESDNPSPLSLDSLSESDDETKETPQQP